MLKHFRPMSARAKDGSMGCKQVEEFLERQCSRPSALLPAPLRRHIRDCGRCAELYNFFRGLVSPEQEVPRQLLHQILRTVLRSLRPVSPLPPTGVIAAELLAVVLLLSLAAVGLLGAGAMGAMTLHQLAAVTAILGLGAAALGVSLGWQMVPGSYARIRPPVCVIAFIGGFLGVLALLFPWQRTEASQFVALGLRCSAFGLLVAIPAAMLVGLVVRRGVVLSPGTAGVTVGLLGGLVGATALGFFNKLLEATHLILWHGATLVVSAAGGFVAARKR